MSGAKKERRKWIRNGHWLLRLRLRGVLPSYNASSMYMCVVVHITAPLILLSLGAPPLLLACVGTLE